MLLGIFKRFQGILKHFDYTLFQHFGGIIYHMMYVVDGSILFQFLFLFFKVCIEFLLIFTCYVLFISINLSAVFVLTYTTFNCQKLFCCVVLTLVRIMNVNKHNTIQYNHIKLMVVYFVLKSAQSWESSHCLLSSPFAPGWSDNSQKHTTSSPVSRSNHCCFAALIMAENYIKCSTVIEEFPIPEHQQSDSTQWFQLLGRRTYSWHYISGWVQYGGSWNLQLNVVLKSFHYIHFMTKSSFFIDIFTGYNNNLITSTNWCLNYVPFVMLLQ